VPCKIPVGSPDESRSYAALEIPTANVAQGIINSVMIVTLNRFWHLSVCRVFVALLLTMSPSGSSARQDKKSSATGRTTQANTTAAAARQRFLKMFARSYYPGRTGQLLIVPREGDFITRPDPNYAYMHGSPWAYDVSIPLLFAGPAVKPGVYAMPAAQQDIAPTLAAALRIHMPPTATGRVLPVLRQCAPQPRAILLLVLDGMRRDYFDMYAVVMPTLTALRRRSAWFPQAEVNLLPTNTAVGHATISTGTDPRVHGITGAGVYDHVHKRRHDLFEGERPNDLMALTLADVWQFATAGHAIIIAQGSIERAATPLAGHGACQVNGTAVVQATYDQQTGDWTTNPDCFRLPTYLKGRNARTLIPADGKWMGHKIESTTDVRHSALFPAFEADAIVTMIEREPIGADEIADLILLNYKAADFVGHAHGPQSDELRATLGEMDHHLTRILKALEAKVGDNYVVAVTADHGMPPQPSSPDRRHLVAEVLDLLHNKFDPEARQLVTSFEPENSQIFIDEERLSALGLTLRDLAQFLESQPPFFAVFTIDEARRAAEAHSF
jgi:hypothetical protein